MIGDLGELRAQGVTEVFFDLNLSPPGRPPRVDAGEALAYAEHVLEMFAPAHTGWATADRVIGDPSTEPDRAVAPVAGTAITHFSAG